MESMKLGTRGTNPAMCVEAAYEKAKQAIEKAEGAA
jgi:hypothetical protein